MNDRYSADWKNARQQEINALAEEDYHSTKPQTSKKTRVSNHEPVKNGDFARSVRKMSDAELSFHGFFLNSLEKHHGHS